MTQETQRMSSFLKAIRWLFLALAAMPLSVAGQQHNPDADQARKLQADLDKAAQERLLRARQDLQAFFNLRKSTVRWGLESRQLRAIGGKMATGKATLRFDFLWAEGHSAIDGQKETVQYWKQAVAEFELAEERWRLADVVWRTPIPDALDRKLKVLVQEVDLLKVLAADKNVGQWFKEGSAFAREGKWDQAISHYTKAIDLEPLAVLPWNERGIAYLRKGQTKRAVEDFTRAIELAPNNPVPWNNRADAYGLLGQWEKTVADSSKAIELKSDFELPWLLRGSAHASLGQWDKATADLTKAAAFPKTALRATGYIALVRLARNDPKGYRQSCTELLEKWSAGEDPREAAIVAWTCSVLPESEARLGRVIEVLEKSDSKDSFTWRSLGAALYRSGKSQQAIEALRKAEEAGKQPSPLVWTFLALAYQQKGQKEEARQWLDKAAAWMAEMRKRDGETKPPEGKSWKDVSWSERLALELILRETEGLLKNLPR